MGAEVSVLPSKTYDKLHLQPSLKDNSMTLTVYGGMPIQPSGYCQMTCSTAYFYVTPVDAHPILGLKKYITIKSNCKIKVKL